MTKNDEHEHDSNREVESRRKDPETGKTYVTVTKYCSQCGRNMGTGGYWE